MKKTLLKALIWMAVGVTGGMAILIFTGVTDLAQLNAPSLLFGGFIGVMGCYIKEVLPE
ncbi:hypothetical protein [Cytobacillus sp. Bac17]|uniref:hypothetical protein n=1 Tax=Cytobacillus sp. Bac17 TaxID=2926008 RepID=UPI002117715D|nr:hypothetical protein [Cytobacillus sp. Bac17]